MGGSPEDPLGTSMFDDCFPAAAKAADTSIKKADSGCPTLLIKAVFSFLEDNDDVYCSKDEIFIRVGSIPLRLSFQIMDLRSSHKPRLGLGSPSLASWP